MKKYILYLASILTLCLLMLLGTFIGIVCYPKNVFHESYQSLIQDKFRILSKTNEPKIILVAGSNLAFGLDQNMLEEASGYKVVNLGLHAGFGHLFYSELSKANINQGDIVLLSYEYGWENENGFDDFGTELVMSGIDNDIQMYKYIPVKKWPTILGYLFTFASKKNSYQPESGIYSREAFDSNTGQMTMRRDYNIEYNEETYGTVNITGSSISEKSISYLLEYKKFIEAQGANVYFVAPPLLADSIRCDTGEFIKLREQEMETIGIPYISNPTAYLYPSTLMSNAIYHCNSEGEIIRTQMLISDLRAAGIIQ